jgi:hypothetical protein
MAHDKNRIRRHLGAPDIPRRRLPASAWGDSLAQSLRFHMLVRLTAVWPD